MAFLSTLSLRRATYWPRVIVSPTLYFYPRSPCGERLTVPDLGKRDIRISIHALLAESDRHGVRIAKIDLAFLSTLSLRRATGSVHRTIDTASNFYPRSPCGERRVKSFMRNGFFLISIHALLAESDLRRSKRFPA